MKERRGEEKKYGRKAIRRSSDYLTFIMGMKLFVYGVAARGCIIGGSARAGYLTRPRAA